MLLLRLGRNAASWEEADAREICLLEFPNKDKTGFDREPSVYEVTVPPGEVVNQLVLQVQAEHAASFLDKPPTRVVNVDIDGLFDGDIVASAGETQFRLTREAHRHLDVRHEDQLVRLVERIREDFPARAYLVTRDEVRRFASDRFRANDPEWLEARANGRFRKWKLIEP